LAQQATEGLREHLATGPLTTYIGFDPTAKSLHVGSLLPILALARFQRAGHIPIAIAGGGTGLIGDPSGKTAERKLLTKEQLEDNLQGIRAQLTRFLDFEAPSNPARIVNNADWLTAVPVTDFLRDVGKYFTVNYMLAKESVDRRLTSEDGISFTEFSYLLLQSYDFLVLFDRYGCTLQMGGSDQWGNITAGCELIRKLRGARAHGLVFPLVTTAAGTKFGKTEAGTVWLDAELTSPFRFYQFWLGTADADADRYLKSFTFLEREAIGALAEATRTAPEKREAQTTLAREVTRLVHGDAGLQAAERGSRLLFGGAFEGLSADDVLGVFQDVPATEMEAERFRGDGMSLVDVLATVALASSKGEARRLVKAGGVYVNGRREADENARLTLAQGLDGRAFVLRKGQKDHHVIKLRA
jgi:tyrosyl-tRNA synthetase